MTNGRFVHHDDNIDESTLRQAGLNAERLYLAKYGVPYNRQQLAPHPKAHEFCIVCFAAGAEGGSRGSPDRTAGSSGKQETSQQAGGGEVGPRDPSCSSYCGSRCSVACRSGCGNYCRGGLCRDQCRAACGYVCGACETGIGE